MEIRARYILIGAFVLAVALGIFGFVYWLNNAGGLGPRTSYRVVFSSPVAGLDRGGQVLFNGIQVGEVTGLGLVKDQPDKVMATIAVDESTPVMADTHVGLIFSGLTGTAAIALDGGTAGSAPAPAGDGGPPLLAADPNATKDMTQAARDVLLHLDGVIADNAGPLKDAIANISTFSKALSDNSGKVGGILGGLEKLTGGGKVEAEINVDLTAPTGIKPEKLPSAQLGLGTPTTVITDDTQRIMTATANGEAPAFPEARWADNAPALMRARLAQGFENAGYAKVGSDLSDINADYKLALDMRTFHVDQTTSPPKAVVTLFAKLIDADGNVVASKAFDGEDAVAGDSATDAAKALDGAFGAMARALIPWTLDAMVSHENGAGGEAGAGDNAAPPPP